MDKQKATTTTTDAVAIQQIKNTPFTIHTKDGKNYITCGRVLLELEKETDIAELSGKLQKFPWEQMGMFCQAICFELIEEMNKNEHLFKEYAKKTTEEINKNNKN